MTARKCLVTAYATDVVEGNIVAGPSVRGACERHLRDLKERRFPFHYDAEAAAKVCRFYETQLRLTGGEYSGQLVKLFPFQRFIISSIMGWKDADGYRRFKTAYIEASKGSAKSPTLAGLGLWFLACDGGEGIEVLNFARTAEQADVVFKDAIGYIEQNKVLSENLRIIGKSNASRILYEIRRNRWKRMAGAPRGVGLSGFRPTLIMFDEIQEMGSTELISLATKNTKERKNSLILFAGNAGEGAQSVGHEYNSHAVAVARGETIDANHFAFVADLDDGDDPFAEDVDVETQVWPKANPALPELPGLEYLRREVAQSRHIPSRKTQTLRLNFSRWVEDATTWVSPDILEPALVDELPDNITDMPMVMGIDLSMRVDLTAVACVFFDDEKHYAAVDYWLPHDDLRERAADDGVPYDVWRQQGFLNTSPGRLVDYKDVAAFIKKMSDKYNVVGITFDQWNVRSLLDELSAAEVEHYEADVVGRRPRMGIPVFAHPQSFNKRFGKQVDPGKAQHFNGKRLLFNGLYDSLFMPGAINSFEARLFRRTIQIKKSPLTKWNMLSAVTMSDKTGNRAWDNSAKKARKRKMDGAVALSMAIGLAERVPADVGGERTVEIVRV